MASPSTTADDGFNDFIGTLTTKLAQLKAIDEVAATGIAKDIKTLQDEHESKFTHMPHDGYGLMRPSVARRLGGVQMILQSQYHSQLRNLRTDDGCRFLLTDFTNWYRAAGSQTLVIFGNIGCGKSVTMSFLIDQLNRRNEHEPRSLICFYYCRDDESGQAVNIFSALILTLLKQLPDLKNAFDQWYEENQASGVLQPARSTKKLEEFLEKVLEELDRPLFIVIDGMNNCDGSSREAVLNLLRTLSRKTQQLKILLSSRPEEEILEQLDEAVKINITSDTNRDAAIVRHKVETQLYYLKPDVKTLVVGELSRSAQGSAIWTKETVDLLEVRRIQAIGPMRKFLEDMPLP